MKWYKRVLEMKEDRFYDKLVNDFMTEICRNDAIRLIVENDEDSDEYIRKEFIEKLNAYKKWVYDKIELQRGSSQQ